MNSFRYSGSANANFPESSGFCFTHTTPQFILALFDPPYCKRSRVRTSRYVLYDSQCFAITPGRLYLMMGRTCLRAWNAAIGSVFPERVPGNFLFFHRSCFLARGGRGVKCHSSFYVKPFVFAEISQDPPSLRYLLFLRRGTERNTPD